ncbi:MAG: hypothetical protein VB143_07585 [Burkholderia sp.]
MAEVLSVQMSKILGSPLAKLSPTEIGGRRRVMLGQVTSIAAAINDTIYFGRLPAGARILGTRVNNAAGTASGTMNIGLRKTKDKSVLSATALASAVAIATAASADVSATGAYTNAGQSYVTADQVDVYGTITGAVTPSSPGQLITIQIDYAID